MNARLPIVVPIQFEEGPEASPDRICVDGEPGQRTCISIATAQAIEFALRLAPAGPLHLVHATPRLGVFANYGGSQGAWLPLETAAELDKAACEYARAVMRQLAARLCPDIPVDVVAGPGKPHHVILNVASRVQAHAIVLASSTHGRVRRALGSTGCRVIREARCPVVVIPCQGRE